MWDTDIEANKEIARQQKRKLSYISNVYVINDPKHPENNGKVFLFRYGTKIFEKITAMMHPEFEDETPINPFDMWTGANFKLKVRKVADFPNYDESKFDPAKALNDDDDVLEAIWNTTHVLADVIDPKQFKTYDVLKARLDRVLRTSTLTHNVEEFRTNKEDIVKTTKPVTQKSALAKTELSEDDDDLRLFSQLAEGDDDIPY